MSSTPGFASTPAHGVAQISTANTGRDGTHNCTTVNDDKKRMITIRLTNHGTGTHTVTVTTN